MQLKAGPEIKGIALNGGLRPNQSMHGQFIDWAFLNNVILLSIAPDTMTILLTSFYIKIYIAHIH